MKTKARNKKVWEKPLVDLMKINRDTFGGSGNAAEGSGPDSSKWRPAAVNSRGGRS